MRNWNTDFNEAFKILTLNYEEAVISRRATFCTFRERPAFRQDADGNPMRKQRGELVMIDGQRRYPE